MSSTKPMVDERTYNTDMTRMVSILMAIVSVSIVKDQGNLIPLFLLAPISQGKAQASQRIQKSIAR
jgi:hypothetical protein